MTKMLDLLEDYMHYRKHRYFRLDGSSAIEDRRDMVRGENAPLECRIVLHGHGSQFVSKGGHAPCAPTEASLLE